MNQKRSSSKMRKSKIYTIILLLIAVAGISCKKDSFPGATESPYISIFDVRNLYKGQPITLTKTNMFGATQIAGVTISDHSGGNIAEGLLMLQDSRRLNKLRGIALSLGATASNYLPGDSLIVNIEDGKLEQIDGILTISGIAENAVHKVSSNNPIPLNRATTAQILASPDDYESVLSVIIKGGFDPLPVEGETLAGTKTLNDGFGNIGLETNNNAAFSATQAPVLANYYGIVLKKQQGDSLVPYFKMRTGADLAILSSTITIPPAIITGFMSDVKGGDGNYEYVQFRALKDIDFSVTPFALVVSNNANASTPTGVPSKGWATGGLRTYKINMFSGKVKTGDFFYAGGAGKTINGSGSTSISSSNWIRAYDYTKYDGDSFGTAKGGLMANSGNSFGIALFADSTVTAQSVPADVVCISGGGSLYNSTAGYRITNNDFYDIKNPITLEDQPFFHQGTNTLWFTYNTADQGYFNMLGGVYNLKLGRWTTARAQNNVLLTKASVLSEIEGEGSTQINQ